MSYRSTLWLHELSVYKTAQVTLGDVHDFNLEFPVLDKDTDDVPWQKMNKRQITSDRLKQTKTWLYLKLMP